MNKEIMKIHVHDDEFKIYFGTIPRTSKICKVTEIHKKNTMEASNWHQ